MFYFIYTSYTYIYVCGQPVLCASPLLFSSWSCGALAPMTGGWSSLGFDSAVPCTLRRVLTRG